MSLPTNNAHVERARKRDEQEMSVGPLLARANLLRMRGQWDEAVAVCTEALRRAPESATAHSLLGDIYEAQSKTDDALQWYGMAVDLDPYSQTDRAKLDRLLQLQNARLLADAATTPPQPQHAPRASAADRSLQWFDRVFPPNKAETVARLIWALSGVVALLIVLAAGFLFLANRNGEANGPAGGDAPLVSGGAGAEPVVMQPPVTSAAPPRDLAPPPAPRGSENKPVAARTTPAEGPASPAPPSSGQAALPAAITRALPAGVTLSDARTDPRNANVLLEIALPLAPDEASPMARARVLRAAILAVRAAAAADATLQRALVRVSLRPSGQDATSDAGLAFIGDTTVAAVKGADAAGGDDAALQALFTNPWWSPALAPSAAPASGPVDGSPSAGL